VRAKRPLAEGAARSGQVLHEQPPGRREDQASVHGRSAGSDGCEERPESNVQHPLELSILRRVSRLPSDGEHELVLGGEHPGRVVHFHAHHPHDHLDGALEAGRLGWEARGHGVHALDVALDEVPEGLTHHLLLRFEVIGRRAQRYPRLSGDGSMGDGPDAIPRDQAQGRFEELSATLDPPSVGPGSRA
jgi:hypothetical protein